MHSVISSAVYIGLAVVTTRMTVENVTEKFNKFHFQLRLSQMTLLQIFASLKGKFDTRIYLNMHAINYKISGKTN